MAQLHGCAEHHHITEDEKTGLMWFKQADKGCGGFGSAHHAFLAWLTMGVWLTVIGGGLMFLVMLLEDGVQVGVDVQNPSAGRVSPIDSLVWCAIQAGFCYIWSYVGYWAMETNNGIWAAIFIVCQLLWAMSLLGQSMNCFDFMTGLTVEVSLGTTTAEFEVAPPAPLFLIPAVAYLINFFAASHVMVFAAITLSKLHHGGNNKQGAHESAPKMPSNTVAPEP